MSNNTEEKEVCQSHSFEKNKYFYGKLMTVSDFETEQKYFDGKRHLINRMLHGSGLICGFEKGINVYKTADGMKISFIDSGVALDCCGREIVVLPIAEKKIVDSSGKDVSDLPGTSYLYLKYKACYDGYVASASNPSSCEEKCCPGRIVEGFEVIASGEASKLKELECPPTPKGEESQVKSWLENLEKEHRVRPSCADKECVFLATVVKDKNGKYAVNYEDTAKHRIFFTQKELYQLFKCHILDTENPHDVTAAQIGALKCIGRVRGNDNGNVDLESENSIVINPDGPNNRITIGEYHSPNKDNPHQVTAAQTGALVSINEVSNPGGNVDLVPHDSIVITPVDSEGEIAIGETHSAKKDNPHKVTAAQTGALGSINGVSGAIRTGNVGGNVDLVAGANVTITSNTSTHTIEIASKGGGVINPGTNVQSVGTKLGWGTGGGYAREDHVHNLGEGVVDVGNLSENLKKQLDEPFTYLRKRALVNTVSTFKALGARVRNDDLVKIAKEIAARVDDLITDRVYLKEDDFVNNMKYFLDFLLQYADKLRQINAPIATEILRLLGLLKEAVDSNNGLLIAIQLDESCDSISQLIPR